MLARCWVSRAARVCCSLTTIELMNLVFAGLLVVVGVVCENCIVDASICAHDACFVCVVCAVIFFLLCLFCCVL